MTYREFVLSCVNPDLGPDDRLMSALLGLTGEVGEVVEAIKKMKYHGKVWDQEKILDEMSDVRFYVEWMCAELGTSTDQLEVLNMRKLRKRYPNGFTPGGGASSTPSA